MNSRDFCYWLQGFFEINGKMEVPLDYTQVETIRNHLNMVFVHEIDPSFGGKEEQEKLNAIHNKTENYSPMKNEGPIKMRC